MWYARDGSAILPHQQPASRNETAKANVFPQSMEPRIPSREPPASPVTRAMNSSLAVIVYSSLPSFESLFPHKW